MTAEDFLISGLKELDYCILAADLLGPDASFQEFAAIDIARRHGLKYAILSRGSRLMYRFTPRRILFRKAG